MVKQKEMNPDPVSLIITGLAALIVATTTIYIGYSNGLIVPGQNILLTAVWSIPGFATFYIVGKWTKLKL